jgi:hypothetical protein
MARNRIVVLTHHYHKLLGSYLHNQYGPGIYPKFGTLGQVKIQLAKTSDHLTFLMKCKVLDTVPKGLILKAPYHRHHSSKITFFQRSISQSAQICILAAMKSSFKHYFLTQEDDLD